MRGDSLTLMLSKVMSPKVALADRDIEGYMTQWEKELEFYHQATGKSAVDADQHRMFMLNMCSPAFRTHLRYRKMMDAELSILRVEIADYLHETLGQAKGGRSQPSTERQVLRVSPLKKTKIGKE